MFSLLFRISTLLSLIITVVLLALRLLSNPWPPSQVSGETLFTDPYANPCETPCLLGVHLGQPMQDATDVLLSHPLTSHLRMIEDSTTTAIFGESKRVFLTADGQGNVKTIQLYLFSLKDSGELGQSKLLTFGKILDLWGPPSSVRIDLTRLGGGYVVWEYAAKNILLETWVNAPRIGTDDWVAYIGINAGIQGLEDLDPDSQYAVGGKSYSYFSTARVRRWYSVPGWLGFASFTHYLADPTCTYRDPLADLALGQRTAPILLCQLVLTKK